MTTETPRPIRYIQATDVQVGDRVRFSPAGEVREIVDARPRLSADGSRVVGVTLYARGSMGRTVLVVFPE